MSPHDVFHEGELLLQERTGERPIAERHSTIIATSIAANARQFLAQQRTLAVASYDAAGRPWASLWLARPGFVRSDDAASVAIDLSRCVSPDDPVASLATEGSELGLLAIDLETRRRLRVNGVVRARSKHALELQVHEVFPNCTKYIQRRQLRGHDDAPAASTSAQGERLDRTRLAFVAQADTAFVASRHAQRGVDVSHRGGEPGFVHAEDAGTLRFPDYPGNGMYMTLGNLALEPRAGVVFVDFAQSRLLSVTGRTHLDLDREEPLHPTGGTARYWSLHVEAWREFALPATLRWELLERSRFNPPATGDSP
jgi:predicted pyridoxine 5'-phosphate oxidase superfamily flavin-nucleotide-binding protein